EAGRGGKALLGVLLLAIGVLIASGLDKRLETALVDASPDWLTTLTTRFWERPTARVRYPSRDNRASFHADNSAGTAGRCGGALTPWGDKASAPDASSPRRAACRPSSDCTARMP